MSKKHIQNIVAESRRTLPITIVYGVGIWLLAGLVNNGWWLQFTCFFASVYAMVHLSNINLLIRIYSRSVPATYVMLSCIAVWLFPSIHGAVSQLGFVLVLLLLFACYQDQKAQGKIFYMSAILGAMSLLEPHYLLFMPILWFLMATTIYSLSFRTFMASVIGIITPYWLFAGWLLVLDPVNPSTLLSMISRFGDIQFSIDYHSLTASQLAYFTLLVILFIVGSIHFWTTSYMDKIRIRQIYSSLILLTLYTIVLLAVQPQMFNVLIYMLTLAVTPIIAHFVTLTSTKASNIFFFVVIAAIAILTVVNLWIS